MIYSIYFEIKFNCFEKECLGNCPKKFVKPVCATDGRTYQNPCILGFITCITKGKTVKKHDGKCCSVTCATVFCEFGLCEQDPATCKFKCGKLYLIFDSRSFRSLSKGNYSEVNCSEVKRFWFLKLTTQNILKKPKMSRKY